MNYLILQRAKELVDFHLIRATNIIGAYLSPNSEIDNVLLVEVDPDVGTTNEVCPFKFHQDKATFILFSPEEWESVKLGILELPTQWGDVKDFITLLGD